MAVVAGGRNVLYNKEEIKHRFNAKFTKKIPGVAGENFWHVSADTRLDDLPSVLS